MKVEMAVENPADVRVTLTSTMTMAQWTLIMDSLTRDMKANGWTTNTCELRDAISSAMSRITDKVSSEPRLVSGIE